MKQISKERIGSKVTKKYDKARTPYQRILENPDVEKIDKEKLREQYIKLNPAKLQREIVKLQKITRRHIHCICYYKLSHSGQIN